MFSTKGSAIIIILAIIPLILWYAGQADNLSKQTTLLTLGQAFGILGISLFAITIILSSRLKILDELFYGLNKAYNSHHILGGISFILILFHPLLLAINYVSISWKPAFNLLFKDTSLPLVFGRLSLGLLIVLLIATFFIKLKYQLWKATHKFLGLSFFLAVAHVFLIPSDVSRNLPLRYYILSLSFIALLAFIYRTILPSVFVKREIYRISKIRQLENVTEVSLTPEDRPLQFKPGQFMFLSFESMPEIHPFSISSSPREKELRISAKNVGDYTSQIKALSIGEKTKIEGPFGKFILNKNREQLWIAGGIGITPFLSMARTLERYKDYRITLIYSVSEEKEAIFASELKEINKNNKNFNIVLWVSKEKGRITAEKIKKIASLKDKEIFICGPLEMMGSLRKQLHADGIENKRIHTEEFSLK